MNRLKESETISNSVLKKLNIKNTMKTFLAGLLLLCAVGGSGQLATTQLHSNLDLSVYDANVNTVEEMNSIIDKQMDKTSNKILEIISKGQIPLMSLMAKTFDKEYSYNSVADVVKEEQMQKIDLNSANAELGNI